MPKLASKRVSALIWYVEGTITLTGTSETIEESFTMEKDSAFGVFIQAILTACVVIFLIINLFLPVKTILNILFILVLISMGYNNQKIYKRGTDY